MAKTQAQKNAAALTVMVHFGEIFRVDRLNVRLEPIDPNSPKSKEVRRSFVTHGWMNNIGDAPIVSPIDVPIPGDTENVLQEADYYVKLCMQERQHMWDALKAGALGDRVQNAKRIVFETLFTREGKLIVPKYLVATAHRRNTMYLLAMEDRILLINDELKSKFGVAVEKQQYGDVIQTEIAVEIRTFNSFDERQTAQVMENKLKADGAEPLSVASTLAAALKSFDIGHPQMFFRDTYGTTSGLKVYGVCALERYLPALRLIFRLTKLAIDHKDFIPWTKVPQVLAEQITRSNPDKLREHNDKVKAGKGRKDDVIMEPLTVEGADTWLRGRITASPTVKIMDQKEIRAIKDQMMNPFIKAFGETVLTKNRDHLAPLVGLAPQATALVALSNKVAFGKFADVMLKLTLVEASRLNEIYEKFDSIIGPVSMPEGYGGAEAPAEATVATVGNANVDIDDTEVE